MSEIKPNPLSPEQREEIVKRHQAATPGLYRWQISPGIKEAHLISDAPRRPVVLSFTRWGMDHAAPVFRDEKGWMRRVDFWVPKDLGRHDRFLLDHPDGNALAHSWADREALLSHIAYLEEENRKKDEALGAALYELERHNNHWDPDCDETMYFDGEIAAIKSALGQTPPGGENE